MENANNLGFSPEFMRKYSRSNDNEKGKDKGIVHIWALANFYKLIALKKRLKEEGFTQKEIDAGFCNVIPKIDTTRRKTDIDWFEDRETGENTPSIKIRYSINGIKTKSYTHGCKTVASIMELTIINNSDSFSIDTRSFMQDLHKNSDSTNPLIKEMAQQDQDFSIISRILSNPDIACLVKSYKDLVLIPCSDMQINRTVNGEDKSLTIPLDQFFISASCDPQEMYNIFKKDSGAEEIDSYLDNIKIF